MTDDVNTGDLERRLARSLRAAAPHPAPDFANRVLRQTASAPQRRRWWTLGAFPVLAAVLVVTLAIVAGLGIANLVPSEPGVGDDATPPPASAEPTDGPPSATPEPTLSPAPPSPSPSAGETADWPRCENEELGFAVSYPPDWWVQEDARPDPGLDPIPGCTYFAPEPVDVPQNAGLPDTIAISFGLAEDPLGPVEPPYVVLSRETTTVDGLEAELTEVEMTEAAAPFFEAGERSYGYRVSLPDGETLAASVTSSAGDYDEEKRVLDLMMETFALLER